MKKEQDISETDHGKEPPDPVKNCWGGCGRKGDSSRKRAWGERGHFCCLWYQPSWCEVVGTGTRALPASENAVPASTCEPTTSLHPLTSRSPQERSTYTNRRGDTPQAGRRRTCKEPPSIWSDRRWPAGAFPLGSPVPSDGNGAAGSQRALRCPPRVPGNLFTSDGASTWSKPRSVLGGTPHRRAPGPGTRFRDTSYAHSIPDAETKNPVPLTGIIIISKSQELRIVIVH